jgi:putative restriction endonuclease
VLLVTPAPSRAHQIIVSRLQLRLGRRSSRIYDREFKRDAYIALGVREVWLVDRWNKEVEVSHARGSGLIVRDVLHWHLPELAVDVEILLKDVLAGLCGLIPSSCESSPVFDTATPRRPAAPALIVSGCGAPLASRSCHRKAVRRSHRDNRPFRPWRLRCWTTKASAAGFAPLARLCCWR